MSAMPDEKTDRAVATAIDGIEEAIAHFHPATRAEVWHLVEVDIMDRRHKAMRDAVQKATGIKL